MLIWLGSSAVKSPEACIRTKLNKISLKDKKLFERSLNLINHELSVYTFENIYIWKNLFDISWAVIGGSLCLFFQDKIGCFLYLPPLGASVNQQLLREAFRIMDNSNKTSALSRIENIEEGDVLFYQNLGYDCRLKSSEYLCLRSALAALRGDRFKAKRACVNYFIKHYGFAYRGFLPQDSGDCLRLYKSWMQSRGLLSSDSIYKGMLLDTLSCLEILLRNFKDLKAVGRVVRVNNQLKGFTFGFELNKNTFCILFEITDLSCKGLSQYIFQRFCAELENYRYINIMDDSGLDNLKAVKLSYHPARLIPGYISTRKDE